jgi:hypothetical protein
VETQLLAGSFAIGFANAEGNRRKQLMQRQAHDVGGMPKPAVAGLVDTSILSLAG